MTATAVTLGAVAVNRQATGDCWARCSKGYACDPKTGTCVAGECAAECVPPSRCTLVGLEFTCAPEPDVVVRPLPGAGVAAGNAGNAEKGQVRQDRQAVVGPTAYANQGPPAPGEPRAAEVKQARACPQPGSDAWFEQSETPPEPRPASDLQRDFVGVWTSERGSVNPSRALAVSSSALFMPKRTAYDVVGERDGRLTIRAAPVTILLSTEFEVTFFGTDRIEFVGHALRRYDCRAPGVHDDMCCSLPRARWVRLGPGH